VAKVINGLNPTQATGFIKFAGFITGALRAGATLYNLCFYALKTFLRDTMFSYLLTKSDFNPFKSAAGNLKMAWTKDEAYWEFKKAGGDQASFASVDRNSLQRQIATLTATGYTDAVWNSVKAKKFAQAWEVGILEPLRRPGEISELMTRLGEFKSSMKGKELTKEALEQAGFNAREITIDFAKAGVTGRAMNQISAFFNANIQGFLKTAEVMADKNAGDKGCFILGRFGR